MPNQKHQKTLEAIAKLFMEFGIKSMTMDDIARHLKISKKTLYNYTSDKADLVSQVISHHIHTTQDVITKLKGQSENAIDHNYKLSLYIYKEMGNTHPSVLYDMEKYYPLAWQSFENHRNIFIKNCVNSNLEQGLSEGLYRADLDISIVTPIHLYNIDALLHGLFGGNIEQSIGKAFLELFRYHIRGIASEKGLEYLHTQLKSGKYEF